MIEATMIILDNSECSRNGDYHPTRFAAQADAVQIIFDAKTGSNPESEVGLMSMGGSGPEVLTTLTTERGKILDGVHRTKINGHSHFSSAMSVAALVLLHRQNRMQKQRIILFNCSPVADDTKALISQAVIMKKNNVNIDIVAFGDLTPDTTSKLEAFNETVKGANGSHLAQIHPGPNLLSDSLVATPILAGEGMPYGGGGGEDASGSDPSNFEFGVNPAADPELALALRMSLEEEKARQEREKAELEKVTKQSALEDVKEEGEQAPLLDKDGEPGPSGMREETKTDEPKDEDKMDTD